MNLVVEKATILMRISRNRLRSLNSGWFIVLSRFVLYGSSFLSMEMRNREVLVDFLRAELNLLLFLRSLCALV